MSARSAVSGLIIGCAVLAAAVPAAAGAVTAAAAATTEGPAAAAATGHTAIAAAARATPAWQPPRAAPGVYFGDASAAGVVACAGNYCVLAGGYDPSNPAGDRAVSGWVWSETGGTWGKVEEIPGLAALNGGKDATIGAISCASAGNCAVGGSYLSAAIPRKYEPFLASQRGGTWGNAVPLNGIAALNAGGSARITAVSCPAPGYCVAAGTYLTAGKRTRPFIVTQGKGIWGQGHGLPGVVALGGTVIEALDCPATGYCAAVGDSPAFLLTETRGIWGKAVRVRGTSAGPAGLVTVSCAAAGNCVAGGWYTPVRHGAARALLVTEAGGRWGSAATLPVGTDKVNTVSCPATANCTAATDTHLVTESGGKWRKPVGVPHGYSVTSVSCAKAGYCSAAGYDTPGAGSFHQAVGVIDQVAGVWQPWELVPGTLLGEDLFYNGVSAVSCGTPGNCALYGYLLDQYGPFDEWAADKQTVPVTTTRLVLSAAKLRYGHEQSERVSVTVAATAGTPGGTVTIGAGARILCSITLTAGKGSCTLTPRALPVGTHKLTALYGINAGFAASHAGPLTLTVVP